jgi:hypothetical protein
VVLDCVRSCIDRGNRAYRAVPEIPSSRIEPNAAWAILDFEFFSPLAKGRREGGAPVYLLLAGANTPARGRKGYLAEWGRITRVRVAGF